MFHSRNLFFLFFSFFVIFSCNSEKINDDDSISQSSEENTDQNIPSQSEDSINDVNKNEPIEEPVKSESKQRVIRIEQWQYCAGCRAAVETFINRAFPVINEAIEVHGQTDRRDLEPFMDDLCHDRVFRHYKDFVEYGCLNLLGRSKADFLAAFDGEDLHEQLQKTNLQKGNYFKMSKEICVKAGACPIDYFKKPAPIKKRTRCDACTDIGDQLEYLKMILYDQNRNHDIIKTVCSTLGYNYHPFSWLEEHCDEIIEEHSYAVLNILDKFNRDSRTAIPEEFCEILKCKYTGHEGNEEDTVVGKSEL